jgi:fumarate reductase subunit C
MIAVHVATIFHAARHGVTAADILARTRGSASWGAFYGAFVVLAAIHGAIGIRTVLTEWTPMGSRGADLAAVVAGLVLCGLGLRAVAALVLP